MAISARCPHCGEKYELDDKLAGKKGRCKVCKTTFRIPAPQMKPAEKKVEPAISTPYLAQIEKHLDKRIGPSTHVFHELVSEIIHLDLHIIPPTHEPPSEKHPLGMDHFTIVTSGLSARPMNVPAGIDASPYAELMIALPEDWPGLSSDGKFDMNVFEDERAWWPFRWLKTVAQTPHENDTFLAPGHTIPNGERAEPFAANTRLGCMLVFPSTLSHRASALQINDQITINFYALYPLYPEEMKFKLKQGLEPLLEKLMEKEVTELIDPDRASVIR